MREAQSEGEVLGNLYQIRWIAPPQMGRTIYLATDKGTRDQLRNMQHVLSKKENERSRGAEVRSHVGRLVRVGGLVLRATRWLKRRGERKRERERERERERRGRLAELMRYWRSNRIRSKHSRCSGGTWKAATSK